MGPMGWFALPDHLARLSQTGDPLEVLDQVVDFEQFREPLERALGYADGSRGGRPPYDPVVMFRILILAARHTVSDDLFVAFEGALRTAGYLPMGGQIVDATLVSAPRQRLTRSEKEAAQVGEPAAAIWPEQPAKAAQMDLDARWTVKTGRQRPPDGAGRPLPATAIPVFGYKNHVAIDRAWGFIRRAAVTDAACYDGSMLPELVTSDNLAASVWADTAYRSAANEAWLARLGRISRIHRKKPPGRPMPRHIARGNAARSAVRARVEHVFAHQKETDGPVRPHHRARPGPHPDRPSEPRLQLPAPRLPRTAGDRRLNLPQRRQTGANTPEPGRRQDRQTAIRPDSRRNRGRSDARDDTSAAIA